MTTPTPAASATPTRRLADLLLDGALDTWVSDRRPGRSWRRIARELFEATGGQVDVTDVTLRSWYPELS